LATVIYWLTPPLLCVILYRRGLTAWFQADDFAWLGLRLQVHDASSLLHALFAPMAQGTIRPWSERAFFLALESLLGLNALPFRICVFLTQFANLALLAAITTRLAGARAAGFCAAILWLVNSSLAWPMVWSSVYNQILCAFFLLGAFWFLLQYIETGRHRDFLFQWIFFLLGFGALEINVVYPALAALYTWLCARRFFRATLLLFVPSAIFTAAHRMVAPAQNGGPYAFHFDRSIPATLLAYVYRALVPLQVDEIKGGADVALACVLGAALVAFALLRIRRNDWLPCFCLGWFFIVLAPVLPLRDHFSVYYLALPSIGLAMLAGYGLVAVWRRGVAWTCAAAVLAAAYVYLMVVADRIEVPWWQRRSIAIQRMVMGVARAHQLHPAQTILLDGVDEQCFRAGVYHHPFPIVGTTEVYLTPGSARRIGPLDVPVEDYELAAGPAIHGLDHDQIVVYQIGGPRLKAITSTYTRTAAQQLNPSPPRSIDVASALTAYLLGPEWYPREAGFRWMPRRATLRIGSPLKPSDKLYLNGFCPLVQLQAGPMPFRVTVDGTNIGEIVLKPGDSPFQISLALPARFIGMTQLDIAIDTARTFRTQTDARELSLAFWSFEIR
jgi:hypothetical protein